MSSQENLSTSPTKRRRSSVHSTKANPMYERNSAAGIVAGMDLSCNSSHLASDRQREDICSPHSFLQTPTRSWGSNRTRAKSELYRKSPRVSTEKQTSRKQNRRRAHSSGLVGKTVLVNNTAIVNQYSIDSSDEGTISSIELETGQVFHSDFELPQLPPRKNKRGQRNSMKSDRSFKAADISSRDSPMSISSSSPIQTAYNVQSPRPNLRRKSKSLNFSKVIPPTWQRRLLHLLTILSLFIILWYDETTNHEMDKAFAKNYERRTANTIQEGELAGIRTVENFSGWHLTLAAPQDEKKIENVRKRRQPRMAKANSLSVQSNQQVFSSNSVKSFTLTDDEIKKKIDETFRKYRARNISPKRSGSVIFAWAFLSLVTVNVAWRMGTHSFRYLTLYIRNATNIYSPSLSRHAHEHCR